MIVLELIHSSLRIIGQLGPGRRASASETTDALLVLNSMLDSWATEKLTVFELGRDLYDWAADDSSYTIGPGGDFDTAPLAIGAEFGYMETGREIEISLDNLTPSKWKRTGNKSAAGYPEGLHNNRAWPRSTLYLWPIPKRAGSLVVYPWLTLAAFASLTQEVYFPAGYSDAIRYGLAIHLGEEWGRPVTDRVFRMAAEKKSLIKSRNIEPLELSVDDALLGAGRGNINHGR